MPPGLIILVSEDNSSTLSTEGFDRAPEYSVQRVFTGERRPYIYLTFDTPLTPPPSRAGFRKPSTTRWTLSYKNGSGVILRMERHAMVAEAIFALSATLGVA